MKTQFSLRAALVAVSIAGIGLGLFVLVRERLENRVRARNQSGQTIEQLWIVVDGGSGKFVMGWRDLPAGSHVSSTFDILGDQQFVLEGKLADGTAFREEHGYVTGGMQGVRVDIAVKPGGKIDFDQD